MMAVGGTSKEIELGKLDEAAGEDIGDLDECEGFHLIYVFLNYGGC